MFAWKSITPFKNLFLPPKCFVHNSGTSGIYNEGISIKRQAKLLQLFNRAHVKKIKQLFDLPDYKLLQVKRMKKENGKTFEIVEDIETHGLLTSNQIMDFLQKDRDLLEDKTKTVETPIRNELLWEKYNNVMVIEIGIKNVLFGTYNRTTNTVDITSGCSVEPFDQMEDIVVRVSNKLCTIPPADLYILDSKIKYTNRNRKVNLSKLLIRNSSAVGICLQRYFSEVANDSGIQHKFHNICLYSLFHQHRKYLSELIKDRSYLENLRNNSKLSFDNYLSDQDVGSMEHSPEVSSLIKIAQNGLALVNYNNQQPQQEIFNIHNNILLNWSLIDAEASRKYIHNHIPKNYSLLCQLIDTVIGFGYSPNSLSVLSDDIIHLTQYQILLCYMALVVNWISKGIFPRI